MRPLRYLLATQVALGSKACLVFSRAAFLLLARKCLSLQGHGGPQVAWICAQGPGLQAGARSQRPGGIQANGPFSMDKLDLAPRPKRLHDLIEASFRAGGAATRCIHCKAPFQSRTMQLTEGPAYTANYVEAAIEFP